MGVFTVKAPPGESDFVLAPSGALPGVLIALIDLGTHQEEYQGKATGPKRQIFLVWELTGERCAEKNRNHVIGRSFTLSFHEKAALRQIVERWRGQPFAEPEPQFDLTKLLGQKCLISIIHNKTSGDKPKTYAKVDTVCLPPKGLVVNPPTLPQVCWEIGCGQPIPGYEWIPRVFGDTIADVIAASEEMRGGGRTNGSTAAPPTNGTPAASDPDAPPF